MTFALAKFTTRRGTTVTLSFEPLPSVTVERRSFDFDARRAVRVVKIWGAVAWCQIGIDVLHYYFFASDDPTQIWINGRHWYRNYRSNGSPGEQ